MSDPSHYSRAPITEAIIDIRVNAGDGLSLADLESVGRDEILTYPERNKTFEAFGQMEVQAGVAATASAKQHQTGYKFADANRKNIWQSRQYGFTFSRLAPYERWAPFRDEARRIWKLYQERVDPSEIQRLAVRYINRIDIPTDTVDLKHYLRTSPEVSPDLPQSLTSYFMQLLIPQPDVCGQVIINQTIVPPAREGATSIVLDIDLFRQENVPDDDDEIWIAFEELHDRKNQIFEACITDKTRELFE